MTQNKTAFITGVTGQDGAHLAAQLLDDGYTVYGGHRRGSSNATWRLDYLGITDKLNLVECQITEPQNLIQLMQEVQPAEIYHLAGDSYVADSFKYPGVSIDVNTHGVINILEATRLVSPQSKLFCASSSEVFGIGNQDKGLCENAEYKPANPYGISKLAALNFVRLYRERYGLHACSGILFNHEGPLRGRSFVTRKITFNMARLKIKGGEPVNLGDLNAARDWGAAEDYVKAMRAMLAAESATDLIIASGQLSTVRDFLRNSAEAAGFDPIFEGSGKDEVCADKSSGLPLAQVAEKYFRPQDTPPMLGDASLLKSLTGWEATINLENLINDMVTADINRWNLGITHV